MNIFYLLPSLISSLSLISIAFYLLILQKSEKKYIRPLSFICFTVFLWNTGNVLTNITTDNIYYAQISALALIFLPAIIFHFSAAYTNFIKPKYYYIPYFPALGLTLFLIRGYYVTGITYLGYGYEPIFDPFLFSINSFIGLLLTIFSTMLLYKFYRQNVGLKKHQSLYVLFAIPANSFLSFLSYFIMVESLHLAQFPVGALLDFIMISLIVYAISRFKLPVETPTEIDFRILAETANDGICIIDQKGHIEYFNQSFYEMVYAPRDKILNQPFTKFLAKEEKEKFTSTYNNILYGEKIERLELSIRNQINKNITVEMNTSPILWNEEVIGSFIIIRNIEERKRVLEALRQSEEKFRTLTENIEVGIFRNSGPKNTFIEANPAIITMFGYSTKTQFLQLKVSDLYQNPNDRKRFNKKMEKYGFVKNEEYLFKKKNGTPFWGSVTAVAIPNNKGEIQYYDGLIEDITERKRTREEIKFYNTLVRHDISNKEQAILGYLELLKDIDPSPQQLQIIDKALGVVYRSISLIRKVSFFEKIKEQKELEIISLDAVLMNSIESFKSEAVEKGIKIQYKQQGFLVKGNPLLEDMFSNLLHNSLTHSGCDTILLSAIREKGFVKVSIEDNGKGIPDEDKNRIFQSHVKGKDSKGSGIGLYLVKKIAESCGGKVEIVNRVKNDFTKGSRFNVYLQQTHNS